MKLQIILPLLLLSLAAVSHADKVDDLVHRAMEAQHIPGLALAVLKDGKIVKCGAYGLASVEFDVPVRKDTKFLLASMTKSFTATSIMMLVHEGKVKLDAPISTYIADAPEQWKAITVRQLLTHTAGLKDRFEELGRQPWQWRTNYSESAMLETSKKTPLDFAPGEAFQYSDQGYFLLGVIIERASDMSYPQFLKTRIFEPLGMKDSSTISLAKIDKGLATGYSRLGKELRHNHRRMEFGLVSHFGMISTVNDLAKWDASLYGEKLLSRDSLELMWTPGKLKDGTQPYVSQVGGYGLGWFVDKFHGHRSVGHGGASGTDILRFPEDKLTVIVLTNLELLDGGDAPGIARDITELYLPEVGWSRLKVRNDLKSANTATLRAIFADLALGKADDKQFTPRFYSSLKPALSQQKAAVVQLGRLGDVSLLDSEAWGDGTIARYLLRFTLMPIRVTILFDAEGRIGYLNAEPERSY